MERLVGLANRLQAACAKAGVAAGGGPGGDGAPALWDTLPQVVAIGGQSAGKSSVLESLVGHDFLPRGAGICTRRPLVLQLVRAPAGEAETATFLHRPGDSYTDFHAVRSEIEAETDRLLGPGSKSVSPEPIVLTVRSPSVPNLSIVDMPGLTKVAVEGQSPAVVGQLEEMSRSYVQGKNVFILAVSPANADIATSDAVRLAREVDPDGSRTLGVLTKVDIMDRGTDARAVLEGKAYKLKHGWVACVNRSQADIRDGVGMDAAHGAEQKFFASRPEYAGFRTGTGALVREVESHLAKALSEQLPKLQAFLQRSVGKLESELEALGAGAPHDRGSAVHEAVMLCAAFDAMFLRLLEGGQGGGERVRAVFEEQLPRAVDGIPFGDYYGAANVRKIVDLADGFQPHLIAPELGIRRLIELGIRLLRKPAEACVERVHAIMRELVESTVAQAGRDNTGFRRFAGLTEQIVATAQEQLEGHRKETRELVQTLVEMEASYYTPERFRSGGAADGGGAGGEDGGGSEQDRHFRRIGESVKAYVDAVCEHIKDCVPKAVAHGLVLRSKASLLGPLYKKIGGLSEDDVLALVSEDPEVTSRRKAVAERLELLRHARREVMAVA